MLLNFSNHPSNKWSDNQIEVACQLYGSVTDWAFPQIEPQSTTQEVQQLAQNYCAQILELAPTAVHVMGEMTFTFALVHLLQTAGIVCIASTTNRNTIDNPDGSKTLQFNFCQFRNYPPLNHAQ